MAVYTAMTSLETALASKVRNLTPGEHQRYFYRFKRILRRIQRKTIRPNPFFEPYDLAEYNLGFLM